MLLAPLLLAIGSSSIVMSAPEAQAGASAQDAIGIEVDASSHDPAQSPDPADLEQLRDRIAERWDRLATGHREDAFSLVIPSYRALNDLEDYEQRFGAESSNGKLLRIRDIRIDRDGARATALMEIDKVVVLPPPAKTSRVTSSHREVWLKRDGLWWYVPPYNAGSSANVLAQDGVK